MIGLIVLHKILTHVDDNNYTLSTEELNGVIDILRKHGNVIDPADIRAKCNKPANSFVITFDDGTVDHYQHAMPVLKGQEVKAVFFVNPYATGRDGYLNLDHLHHLQNAGYTIGSHSYRHAVLTTYSDEQIHRELERSIDALKPIAGTIKWLAPPYGVYNKRVVNAAEKLGITYFRTTRFGWNTSLVSNGMSMLNVFNVNRSFTLARLNRCLSSKLYYNLLHKTFMAKKLIRNWHPR
ncbi:MAG: polysaccharide deacetylase family protein [Nitrospirae bacterium]|nr:polysaccharide deacetylase family protein [Nitrospirota bacterium]